MRNTCSVRLRRKKSTKKYPFSVVHSVFPQYVAYCILTNTHRLSYGTLEFRVQVHTHVPWYFGASYFRTKLLVTTQTRFILVLRAHGYSCHTIYIEPEDTMSFYDTQFHDESSWVSSKNVTVPNFQRPRLVRDTCSVRLRRK